MICVGAVIFVGAVICGGGVTFAGGGIFVGGVIFVGDVHHYSIFNSGIQTVSQTCKQNIFSSAYEFCLPAGFLKPRRK